LHAARHEFKKVWKAAEFAGFRQKEIMGAQNFNFAFEFFLS